MKSFRIVRVLVAVIAAVASRAPAQVPPGLPEPGLFLYGPVVNRTNGLPVLPATVAFQVIGGGGLANVNASLINVNGSTFYVARVPFETRAAAGLTFGTTPGTLELKAVATNYTRAAFCDGQPAALVASSLNRLTNFTFGAVDRGVVERLTLGVNKAPVSNVDTDHDGMSDFAENIAGTNPNDPNSVFRLSPQVTVDPQGRPTIHWPSVAGRKYTVSRTANVTQPFVTLRTNLLATPPTNFFTDTNLPAAPVMFYRIAVSP